MSWAIYYRKSVKSVLVIWHRLPAKVRTHNVVDIDTIGERPSVSLLD